MNQYYDQPGWRQRGPEDVAGVLVLFACAPLDSAGTSPCRDSTFAMPSASKSS